MNIIQTAVLNKKEKFIILFTIADILFIFTYLVLSIFQQQLFRYMEFSVIFSAFILYLLLLILSLLFAYIETRQFKESSITVKNNRLIITENDKNTPYPMQDLSHVILSKLYYFLTPYYKVNLYFTKNKKVTSFYFLILKDDAKKLKAYISQSTSIK
ncbi:MAG TPA: hypothetical protein DC003_02650 [Acholeplasmataceae bacterium]|nr:hypothetical protein [Acholeplasmataceae bacterium]